MFYDVYKSLCIEKGVKPFSVVKELEIKNSSNVAQWKKGSMPHSDTLKKVADYFNIPLNVLLSWIAAVDKFGFCWGYVEREQLKANARIRMAQKSLSDEEYIEERTTVFKALFSRSLQTNGYNLSHVDFNTYVAMLLHQEFWKKEIPQSCYNKMVETYGSIPGIEKGTIFCENKITAPRKKGSSRNLATRISALPTEDVSLVSLVVEQLLNNPEVTRPALDLALKAVQLNRQV